MLKLVVAGAATVGGLVVVPLLATVAMAGGARPSAAAIEDIPPAYLAIYQDAVTERCPTLPWPVLAAIGKIESNHGRTGSARLQPDGRVTPPIIGIPLDSSSGTLEIRDTDGGLFDADAVYDRAVGPMQFLPTTWALSGLDASGDGLADPHNAIDAIHAAAAHLCAVGADDPSRIRDAVWAYNHSSEYVDSVLVQASRYALDGLGRVAPSATLIAMVLTNLRIEIYPEGRQDVAAGLIDVRILTILQLASERHTLTVSSLKTGHSRCVGGREFEGCTVSHHWYGRAVDISIVDGEVVSPTNQAARELALWLATLPGPLRFDELGGPFGDLRDVGAFSDPDHANHLHVGVLPKP